MSDHIESFPEDLPRTDDNIMMVQFVDAMSAKGYRAMELEKGYLSFMGALDKEEETAEILEIGELMRSMADRGFPINRFPEIISAKDDIEHEGELLLSLIDRLSISDKEKVMLRSIVEKRRSGTIDCYAGDRIIRSFEIDPKGKEEEDLLRELLSEIARFLRDLPEGTPYQFTFSEA
jgi:hypothetical protein